MTVAVTGITIEGLKAVGAPAILIGGGVAGAVLLVGGGITLYAISQLKNR